MKNLAILIGNLGQDPELKYTQNGTAVVTLSVATSESWNNKEGGKEERAEWHRVVAWRKLAEVCGEHLRKGSKVYVEGTIRTRQWEDDQGNKRYTTEIEAREVKFLSPKSDGGVGRDSGGPTEPGPGVGDDVPF